MRTINIKNHNALAAVSPFGAYVTEYVVGNTPILYQGESLKRTGIPILFPYAGSLENGIFSPTGKLMPQHGFGRDSTWRVVERKENKVILELKEEDIAADMQEAYPYQFTAQLSVSLEDNDLLSYQLLITNNSNTVLPLAPGIHPYFAIPHTQKDQLVIEGIPEFNAKEIDWNNIDKHSRFYGFHGKIVIKMPHYTLELTDNNVCNTLVVWSTDDQKDFVCIEPITRPFNAINTNPILVEPGKGFLLSYVFIPKYER